MPRALPRFATSLLILGCSTPAALAACPQRPAHAVIAAEEVVAAFAAQAPNQRRTELSVACLSAVPTPAQSAAIYAANAVIQLNIGDDPGALLWLRAMVEADPAAPLSPTLAPPDHALYTLYAQAQAAPPSPRAVAPIPRRHTLWVDGVEAVDVPLERPALLALKNGKGQVVWSDLVPPGADLEDEWRGVQVSPKVYAWMGVGAGLVVGYYTFMMVTAYTGMPGNG